jgi:uncharacterized protein (TIGR02145 family)
VKKLHSARQGARLAALVLALPIVTASALWAGEIHDAAAAGDVNKVRALLEADPTALDSEVDRGYTALQMACSGGPPTWTKQVAVANFLIDKGANVNARSHSGYTALHRASSGPRQDLNLVRRLLEEGADVSAQGPNGRTPLSSAAQSGNVAVAKLLIAHGADVNAFDKYRGPVQPWDLSGTILQVAINYGESEEMAEVLVGSGARLGQKDPNGNTELHLAVLKGYVDLVQLLAARGADVNAVNGYGRTALYYAAKHGYRRAADALTSAGAKTNGSLETNYGRAPQLTATLKEGEAHIWGVGFLAYAVKTKGHLLVFNPSGIDESVEAGLANGHLNPNELAGQRITVLITEPERRSRPELFELTRRMPGVDLVTGFKPPASSADDSGILPYRLAAPSESLSVGDIRVHTIPALCGGVGYLVEVDGIKVLHAGLHASSNEASQMEQYSKEIDFLKPFGPIDVAMLSVFSHAPRIVAAYEPHLYLLDQLSPRAVYLKGANTPEEYPKCAEILRSRNIPVAYPEGGLAEGERSHYVREQPSATTAPRTNARPNSSVGDLVTDIDGNTYRTVTIGSQVWMAEDLRTTRYRNGDLIGTTSPSTLDISGESAPKYQWAYAGDEGNVATYGRLYTWHASTDNRSIAPVGWHVPTDAEWVTLTEFLGGEAAAQGKLKEAGTTHWSQCRRRRRERVCRPPGWQPLARRTICRYGGFRSLVDCHGG